MDYKQFTYILKVAELQNITKAAEELYISQSALSHYINKIEKDLGAEIFDRRTTPISLTDAGKLYISVIQDILAKLESLNDGIKQINSYKTGTIKIGIPKSRASYMLPFIIPRFIEKYPEIKLEFTEKSSKSLLSSMSEGKIDFIIIPKLSNTNNFYTVPIYQEELLLVTPKNMKVKEQTKKGVITNLKTIDELPLVMLNKGRGIRTAIDLLFEQFNVSSNIILETTSNETAYRIASTGTAACIVPNITTKIVQTIKPVKKYSLTGSGIHWEIAAMSKKEKHLTPPMRYFIDLSKKILNSSEV